MGDSGGRERKGQRERGECMSHEDHVPKGKRVGEGGRDGMKNLQVTFTSVRMGRGEGGLDMKERKGKRVSVAYQSIRVYAHV